MSDDDYDTYEDYLDRQAEAYRDPRYDPREGERLIREKDAAEGERDAAYGMDRRFPGDDWRC